MKTYMRDMLLMKLFVIFGNKELSSLATKFRQLRNRMKMTAFPSDDRYVDGFYYLSVGISTDTLLCTLVEC